MEDQICVEKSGGISVKWMKNMIWPVGKIIQILDATLRDGGFGLEDADKVRGTS